MENWLQDLTHRLLDPEAPFIDLFGPAHLLYTGVVAVAVVVVVACRQQVRAHAAGVRATLLVLAVLQQMALYGYQVLVTGWDPGGSGPLHISRLTTLLLIAYLLTGRRAVLEVAFYFGLYAYFTFMLPQRIQPPDHLMGISFLLSHALIILVPIIAGITRDWRPSTRGLWIAYGWFLAYFVTVLAANQLTDGNYFYLKHRPLLRELPDPLYALAACAATLVVFWFGYGAARLIPTLAVPAGDRASGEAEQVRSGGGQRADDDAEERRGAGGADAFTPRLPRVPQPPRPLRRRRRGSPPG